MSGRKSRGICGAPGPQGSPSSVLQEGVEVRVARIFNTFGPRMHMNDGRVVSNFILQALQGEPLTVGGGRARGECVRSGVWGGACPEVRSPRCPWREGGRGQCVEGTHGSRDPGRGSGHPAPRAADTLVPRARGLPAKASPAVLLAHDCAQGRLCPQGASGCPWVRPRAWWRAWHGWTLGLSGLRSGYAPGG